MGLRKLCCLLFISIGCMQSGSATAQVYDTASKFTLPVQLDSYVVHSGFDVGAFINRVRNDTTFYKAFKNLHFVPYKAVNDIKAYDKNGSVAASEHSSTKQFVHRRCRIIKTIEKSNTGDYYKRNGKYNYYTSELFASLFLAPDSVCGETDIVKGSLDAPQKGELEKRKYELKQLIFNPGTRVSGIPFMGDRASVFDPGEAEKYDFKIGRELHDKEQCYAFRITPKAGYEHKTLYNYLTTWFRISDYSILARDYSLSYRTLVYDFDVVMKFRLRQIGDKLYPVLVNYDGNWHVFTKKREHVKFNVEVTY